MAVTLTSTVETTDEQVNTTLDDDLVILNLENSVYYGFQDDPVADFIWKQLGSPKPVSVIVDAVLSAFDVERAECEADVLEFLTRLEEEQLLVVCDDQD